MNNVYYRDKFYLFYFIGFLLILVLPLASFAPLMHPPSFAKSIVFRIILSVLILVFVYQILFKKQIRGFDELKKEILNKKSLVFIPFWLLVLYGLIILLSTLFSLEPQFSFFGSPYRGGGSLTFSFYIIFSVLVFFIINKRDWIRLWNLSFGIGLIVASIGIIQKFGLFSKYIMSYSWQPVSTMGGPIFLALYLLLLSFLCLSFGLNTKNKLRYFYFFCLIVYISAILITANRASFIGLSIGLLFYLFFYPASDFKKRLWLRGSVVLILFLIILSVLALRNSPQSVENLSNNKLFGVLFQRSWDIVGNLSVDRIIASRASGWIVGLNGLKERPILGYGPENFSIAFDKYYDPSLPGISKGPGGTSWWDRAHNFMLDISVTAGIPALIIYLLIIGFIFFIFQKLKKTSQDNIILHGIQATFIGYLIADFFSFDVFSTYLVFFLLISYCLSLIYEKIKGDKNIEEINEKRRFFNKPSALSYVAISILAVITILFIGSYNLKPLEINKKINIANILKSQQKYDQSLMMINNILDSRSILDSYVYLNYIDILNYSVVNLSNQDASKRLELIKKTVDILEKSIEIRPYYTRNWLFYGSFLNQLANEDNSLNKEKKEELVEKAYSAIEKAYEFSPKRQEVSLAWAKINFINGKYEEAEKEALNCVNLNPDLSDCWWQKALVEIELNKTDEAAKSLDQAARLGYSLTSQKSVSQLINAYTKIAQETNDLKYFKILADLYKTLIEYDYNNFQNHASLAFIYMRLEDYENARKEAYIVLELSPESKPNVDAFLKSLPD
ncbi:MAG: O-antigen ligase family protein [Candidatus Pacebacteria bacterium]|nr:O-antigen ligase family protein [Candidatus Paceibacterota bacterium]